MVICSWTVAAAQLPAIQSDSVLERKIAIDFPINSWEIDSAYSDNAANLLNLRRLLSETRTNPLMSLDSLKVSGYASPDGSLPKNKELSLRRAISLRQYLHDNCSVPDSLMQFGENIVSWNLFRNIVSASDYSWRDDAMHIMTIGSDNNAVDNTRRMNRLKKLAGGEAWSIIKRDILPRLRSAFVVTTIITIHHPQEKTFPEETPTSPCRLRSKNSQFSTQNSQFSTQNSPLSTQNSQFSTLHSQFQNSPFSIQKFALKTNAAYLAAGVTNIGAEMAVSPHWSIDLPLVYSPYTLARAYRMRFLYIQPEARYWLGHPLKGHFFGVHAHAGVANVSFDHDNRYQTPNGFYGAGISYGYSLPIAKRWSLEFTIGAGYFFTKYDTYYNIGTSIGQRYKKGTPLNYWGIDKLGINFVYRFGHKSAKTGKEVAL